MAHPGELFDLPQLTFRVTPTNFDWSYSSLFELQRATPVFFCPPESIGTLPFCQLMDFPSNHTKCSTFSRGADFPTELRESQVPPPHSPSRPISRRAWSFRSTAAGSPHAQSWRQTCRPRDVSTLGPPARCPFALFWLGEFPY